MISLLAQFIDFQRTQLNPALNEVRLIKRVQGAITEIFPHCSEAFGFLKAVTKYLSKYLSCALFTATPELYRKLKSQYFRFNENILHRINQNSMCVIAPLLNVKIIGYENELLIQLHEIISSTFSHKKENSIRQNIVQGYPLDRVRFRVHFQTGRRLGMISRQFQGWG